MRQGGLTASELFDLAGCPCGGEACARNLIPIQPGCHPDSALVVVFAPTTAHLTFYCDECTKRVLAVAVALHLQNDGGLN